MIRTKVESSNINSIGYDQGSRELEIEFKRGDVYIYSNVEKGIAIGIVEAESVGKYFHKYIKGAYEYRKLERIYGF